LRIVQGALFIPQVAYFEKKEKKKKKANIADWVRV